ncbi:unnamed protein product [Tilletia controversa]|nr:unnamed protein product [Tilletia controversa]
MPSDVLGQSEDETDARTARLELSVAELRASAFSDGSMERRARADELRKKYMVQLGQLRQASGVEDDDVDDEAGTSAAALRSLDLVAARRTESACNGVQSGAGVAGADAESTAGERLGYYGVQGLLETVRVLFAQALLPSMQSDLL